MKRPEGKPSGNDGNPRFGRLLVVLVLVVAFIVAIVAASEAWFTP